MALKFEDKAKIKCVRGYAALANLQGRQSTASAREPSD